MEPSDRTLEAFVPAMMHALEQDVERLQAACEELERLAGIFRHILEDPEGEAAMSPYEEVVRQAFDHIKDTALQGPFDYVAVLEQLQAQMAQLWVTSLSPN